MRHIFEMAPQIINGTRQERVRCLADIGIRFAAGAFIVSGLLHFADPFIAANLSTNGVAALGGVLTVVITAIKTA